jgi:Na+-driven multidrug efflux pump
LFSSEPAVLAAGALYLRIVAPFYGIFGMGMMLYFAGQGAGRVVWPVLAGTARLIIATAVGWFVVGVFGGGLKELFITVAVSLIVFGGITIVALRSRGWSRNDQSAVSANTAGK